MFWCTLTEFCNLVFKSDIIFFQNNISGSKPLLSSMLQHCVPCILNKTEWKINDQTFILPLPKWWEAQEDMAAVDKVREVNEEKVLASMSGC